MIHCIMTAIPVLLLPWDRRPFLPEKRSLDCTERATLPLLAMLGLVPSISPNACGTRPALSHLFVASSVYYVIRRAVQRASENAGATFS